MRRPSWALGAGVLALALAPAPALAGDPSGGLLDQVQKAGNGNSTTQQADSSATTKQANVNVPVSVLSKGANNGDVDQSNHAKTTAKSSNDSATEQNVDQSQNGSASGSRAGSVEQDQSGSNDNKTDQKAGATASTEQANVNVSGVRAQQGREQRRRRSVQPRQDDGEVVQSQRHRAERRSVPERVGVRRSSDRGCCSSRGGKVGQEQSGSNDNATDQKADSKATTKQANLNAPIALGSGWKSHGDRCRCDGRDRGQGRGPAKGHDHRDKGRGRGGECGCDEGHPRDRGHRDRGDDHQSNDARTSASSSNGNAAEQDVGQSQDASAPGSRGGSIDQRQDGSNKNETKQDAKSEAGTKQANLNVPISFLSDGSNNGDVDQSDDAWTSADSSNDSATGQDLTQTQQASTIVDDRIGWAQSS